MTEAPRGWMFGAILASLLIGCAAPSISDSGTADAPPEIRRPPEPRSGVVVERLLVRKDDGRLDALLAGIEPSATPPAGADALRREGFRAMLVSETDVARLEGGLGPDAFVGRTWHGEATAWRPATSRRLNGGSAMLVDGRTRRIEDRILTLGLRGWSLPTVNGASLQIEVVPYVAGGPIDPLAPPRPPQALRGDPLAEMLTCTLADDEILLLVSDHDLDESTQPSPTPENESTSIFAGPVAAAAPTPAAWLLDDPFLGDRGVLLIRGRPNPNLLPPDPVPSR